MLTDHDIERIEKLTNKTYLGDGVYFGIEDFYYVLYTAIHIIYLERKAIASLLYECLSDAKNEGLDVSKLFGNVKNPDL